MTFHKLIRLVHTLKVCRESTVFLPSQQLPSRFQCPSPLSWMLEVTSTSLPALVLALPVLCSQFSSHCDHLLLNLNQIIASLPCSKGFCGSPCHQEPIHIALEDVTSSPLTLAMLVSFLSANQVHLRPCNFLFFSLCRNLDSRP